MLPLENILPIFAQRIRFKNFAVNSKTIGIKNASISKELETEVAPRFVSDESIARRYHADEQTSLLVRSEPWFNRSVHELTKQLKSEGSGVLPLNI